jgi:hypothetical protein
LLIRLVVCNALLIHAVTALRAGPPLGPGLFDAFLILMGLLLAAGFWTPMVGVLIAASALLHALSHPAVRGYCLIVGTLGLALALLGPGAWSVDACLFGWKRLEIRDRTSQDSPP